ncbi:hypothetical protein FAM18123_01337 [Lacticaseibacillus paracasei]|nr:hypothetical protein FAM18123_01337 [Lacticaseibacillus paracasei]
MNRLRLSLTGFFGPNEHYLVAEQHDGIKIIYSVDPRVSTPIFTDHCTKSNRPLN